MKNIKFLFKRLTVFSVIVFLPVLLSGCIPTGGNSNNEGSPDYVKGAVVKGFPALPLYPKSRVVESYNFNSNLGVSFISSDNLGKVVNFYSQGLQKLGWEQNLYKQSETSYVFDIKNTKFVGSVAVNTASDGKKTAISFYLFPRN